MPMETIISRDKTILLDRPRIMGVLNVTPDSFSDGGKFLNPEIAVRHARQMVEEGADIIDVGGESTRPGPQGISVPEELERVMSVVERLVKEISVPISIDTQKPEVADEALGIGVHMLNDISGLRSPKMLTIAAKHNVPTIIMHMQGTPETMQKNPQYENVVEEIAEELCKQAAQAKAAGIDQVIVDPGIGFGKTLEHNLQILKHLKRFTDLGYPLMVGPSRKGFLGKILGTEVHDRLEGTLAAVVVSVMHGANIVRVHDVKECARALQIVHAIQTVL